jgi:ribA/ribD-fused uncharacterized protein
MRPIESFAGDYRWLSNFFPALVIHRGTHFSSVEHAYQAAKTDSMTERATIQRAETPAIAKRLGRKVTLRPAWDAEKEQVMLECLREKFKDPDLRARLIGTGDAKLVEGNYWGDTYWGVCRGSGQNRLGVLLMRVRDEVR